MTGSLLAGGLGPLTRGAAEALYVAVVLSLVALAGSLLTAAAVRRRRAARARREPAVIVPTLQSMPQPRGRHARPAPPDAPLPAQQTRPPAPARHAARPSGRHRRPARR